MHSRIKSYHWYRHGNNKDISNNVGNCKCVVQDRGFHTLHAFNRRTGPIGRKIGPTNENNRKEEGDGPDYHNEKHSPRDKVELGSCVFSENSPIKKYKARFDQT